MGNLEKRRESLIPLLTFLRYQIPVIISCGNFRFKLGTRKVWGLGVLKYNHVRVKTRPKESQETYKLEVRPHALLSCHGNLLLLLEEVWMVIRWEQPPFHSLSFFLYPEIDGERIDSISVIWSFNQLQLDLKELLRHPVNFFKYKPA